MTNPHPAGDPHPLDTARAPRHPHRGARRVPVVFLAVFTLVLGLANACIGLRLLPPLHPGIVALSLGIGWLALSTLLVPAGLLTPLLLRRLAPRAASLLAWSGLVVAGLTSTLFVLTLLRDIALGIAALATDTSRYAAPTALGVIALSLALTAIGVFNARRTPRVVQVDVPLPDLHPALDGFRIVQITDMHVGPTIRHGFLRRVVDRVNTLDAHAVAITGDLVDGSVEALAPHTAPLRDLRARYGAYFVTGNHDFYSGVDGWLREIRRLGITVLHNQHVRIEHDGAPLVLGGVSDHSGHLFGEEHRCDPHKAIAGAQADATKILLAHQPRTAPAAAAAGFHLQLSGHTHGGQFLPWNFFVPLQQPFTAGLHRLAGMWIYTSRGTGYWGPPKRLGAPSEITLVRLVRAPAAATAGIRAP